MKFWKYMFGLLILVLVAVIIAFFQLPDGNLHIIACNVGQGDAILMIYGNIQILTDGGPDKNVLSCLGKYIPFWDRQIELVISTHPDADHSTGLVEVLKNYNVGEMLINPIDPGTQVYEALRKEVGGRGVIVVNPLGGMSFGIDLIRLDILNPNGEDFNRLAINNEGDKLAGYAITSETNLYSIAYRLSFKNFTGLFLGDTPPSVNNALAEGYKSETVNYIKIPHHGSANGLTENLLRVVVPNIAVISVGKNSWGFPKQEILDILSKYGAKVLRTDQAGDIEVITDGNRYWIR